MTEQKISFAEAMLACVIAQRHWDDGCAIGDVWRKGAYDAAQFYRGESMRSYAPVQILRALEGGPAQDDAVADAKDGRIEAMHEAGDLRLQLTACQQALIREGMERDAAIAKVRELERQLEIMSDIGKHFDSGELLLKSGELLLKTTAIGMPAPRAQAVLDAALDAHDPTGGWQYGSKMGKLGSAVRAYREVNGG